MDYLHYLVSSVVERAKLNNIPYDNKEDLYNYLLPIFEKNICECCKKEFNIEKLNDSRNNSPSIDRIIPEKGYVVDNVAILCMECNRRKANMTWEEMNRITKWIKKRVKYIQNIEEKAI